ncbi:hypothetical protein HDF26_003546 [Pedobacter cryoconitis]|uniref:DUF4374 domain-containing protein n=1 Tax=Pedobacter cryoconitis TaxID=188932 RepID=A0A7W8ZLH8_9SPHI|nr:DUF4374 domain-containing protein [Pedobacter cryoconitis]MBB5635998.1 hypothetical protein [Pedobacter cryoconitis]MBB6273086.1 hypothetical protein [Pedobacter cryoconitis]
MLKANKLFPLLASAIIISGLSSCKKSETNTSTPDEKPVTESTYSLRVSAGNPAAEYLLQVGSLTSGTANLLGIGVGTNLTTITTKNGFYYGRNDDTGNLVKYTSNNKVNTIVKEIPFTQISWAYYSSFYKWKDDKTLILFSSNASIQFEYAILNVETMTITSSGKINVPGLLKDHYFWGYGATIVDNKINLTYTQNANAGDLPVDTTYLATFDYPAMNNIKVTKDTRFTLPEHYSLNMSNSFVDNGISYFMASPNTWTTDVKNKPFGIFRVKSGATQIDPDYFYELTERTKEEALGLFYIGNGKAIVKVLDRSQIVNWESYTKSYIMDYYVVDVVNKTKTKLNIPKSMFGFSEDVLLEDGKVSIAAKTTDGVFVYQYNPATSVITKGLKIEGINSLSRLDKIK